MYIVVPVRSALLVSQWGPEGLAWAYAAGALATGAAVWAYNHAATFLERRRLLGASIAVLAASILLWFFLIKPGAPPVVSLAFYLWSDAFSIVSVTLVWSFANDVFSPKEAKRAYGLIAAAGSLGSVLGSWITKISVQSAGTGPLILLAAALYAANLGLFALAESAAGAGAARSREPEPDIPLLEAARASPLLSLLAFTVVLERVVPDLANYLFTTMAHAAYPEMADLAAFSAAFLMWENIAALLVNACLTAIVLRRCGTGVSLLGAPLANLLSFLFFLGGAGIGWAVVSNGMEGLQRHTWYKAGKECVYTAVDKRLLYRFKAAVEMFLNRFSKGIAGVLILLATGRGALGLPPSAMAALGAPLALAWGWSAWRLGKGFDGGRISSPNPGPGRAAP